MKRSQLKGIYLKTTTDKSLKAYRNENVMLVDCIKKENTFLLD